MSAGTMWGPGEALASHLDAYTAAEDRVWDARLLVWDVLATMAHVEGLGDARLITPAERRRLRAVLRRALADVRAGRLVVTDGDEDAHTALERALIARAGPLGEKVHTGRSRNDQVVAAMRLYLKDRLLALACAALDASSAFVSFATRHRDVLWPGYTHGRRAMPSSVAMWAAGYAEGLLDDVRLLEGAFALLDRSPLGSAAGFGVPLPLDRTRTARRLGFATAQRSVTAVQASRGKLEVAALAAAWAVAHTLGKAAWDAILLSSDDCGLLVLPVEATTGSSIMPHKRNPDLFELTRAREALVAGWLAQAIAVCGKLPGGYHRDLQVLKGPTMQAIDAVEAMAGATARVLPRIAVDHRRCAAALTGGVLATDEVYRRVRRGVPFRAAYRAVAAELHSGGAVPELAPGEILASRRHLGGAGNLGLAELRREITGARRRAAQRRRTMERALRALSAPR